MKFIKYCSFMVYGLLLACQPQNKEYADLILIDGKVWTGDPDQFEEAIAIRKNKIMQVGSTQELKPLINKNTKVIQLHGKLVIPGFNDAHIHFLGGSIGLSEVELSTASSLDEIRQRLYRFAKENPDRKWITGRGWQYTLFPGGMPTKEFLDTLSINRPVFLRAYDGHSALANSRALALAGVDKAFVFDGYGEVIRDKKNGPTGALTESAQGLIAKIIPPLTIEDKLNALRNGMKVAASLGITSIQNASGSADELALYDTLLKNGELTLRTVMAFSVGQETTKEDVEEMVRLRDAMNNLSMLKASAVKFMLDGVIESHTAAMLEPYSDFAARGNLSMPSSRYRELVSLMDASGFQIYTHAIGDAAVREALDAYEDAMRQNVSSGNRHRIEHIETISPDDIPRFSKLGVLPSMEPIHAEPGTISVWSKAVGERRLPNSFPWSSFLKSNAQLVFSSDWPACISLDPLYGIHVAVTRCTPGGNPPGGWIPDQRISVSDALKAYTEGGAYSSFEETSKGKLSPGYLADVVVLSQDLFSIDPMLIHKTKVALTVFDGKIIYQDTSLLIP